MGVSDRGEQDSILTCSTTLSFRKKDHENGEEIKGVICMAIFDFQQGAKLLIGQLYFLDTGLLFLCQTLRLYLPFKSLSKTYLVLMRDFAFYSDSPAPPEGKGRPASLGVHIQASEPYYTMENASEPNVKEDSQDSMLLNFTEMPVDLLDKVRAYAMKHSINFKECGQLYYDFAKNLMMTGWLPLK